jgi:hypothetical protein
VEASPCCHRRNVRTSIRGPPLLWRRRNRCTHTLPSMLRSSYCQNSHTRLTSSSETPKQVHPCFSSMLRSSHCQNSHRWPASSSGTQKQVHPSYFFYVTGRTVIGGPPLLRRRRNRCTHIISSMLRSSHCQNSHRWPASSSETPKQVHPYYSFYVAIVALSEQS